MKKFTYSFSYLAAAVGAVARRRAAGGVAVAQAGGPARRRAGALLLGFNVVRIGPMYSNFAHVYTLCHMEAHRRYQLWGRRGPWGYVFNWWVGLYHGVLPGTFTASHLYNHHRFDNDVRDAYSTAGYPRDSIVSLLRYLVVWCFYATNLSTLYDFYKRRMPLWFCHTALGTAYYAGFVALAVHATSARWALWTIGYPLVEGNILLAVVNFTWHMFLEEGNEYVNSTTIEEGTEFIFSEEYHVVHHQAPGYHHTRYRAHYEKHRSKYDLVFEKCNLFELGFTAIFRNYERLRGFVKDPTPETIDILKRRLRCTWWWLDYLYIRFESSCSELQPPGGAGLRFGSSFSGLSGSSSRAHSPTSTNLSARSALTTADCGRPRDHSADGHGLDQTQAINARVREQLIAAVALEAARRQVVHHLAPRRSLVRVEAVGFEARLGGARRALDLQREDDLAVLKV